MPFIDEPEDQHLVEEQRPKAFNVLTTGPMTTCFDGKECDSTRNTQMLCGKRYPSSKPSKSSMLEVPSNIFDEENLTSMVESRNLSDTIGETLRATSSEFPDYRLSTTLSDIESAQRLYDDYMAEKFDGELTERDSKKTHQTAFSRTNSYDCSHASKRVDQKRTPGKMDKPLGAFNAFNLPPEAQHSYTVTSSFSLSSTSNTATASSSNAVSEEQIQDVTSWLNRLCSKLDPLNDNRLLMPPPAMPHNPVPIFMIPTNAATVCEGDSARNNGESSRGGVEDVECESEHGFTITPSDYDSDYSYASEESEGEMKGIETVQHKATQTTLPCLSPFCG